MGCLALALVACLVAGLFSAFQFWLNGKLEGHPHEFLPLMVRHVMSWSTWGLAAPGILWLSRRWGLRGTAPSEPVKERSDGRSSDSRLRRGVGLQTNRSIRRGFENEDGGAKTRSGAEGLVHRLARSALVRHLVVSIGWAALHRPFHVWIAWYPFWGSGPPGDFVRDFTFLTLFSDIALYWSLVLGWTLFEQRQLLRKRELDALRLTGERNAARLAALEQQVRPHFLFNVLHALQSLQRDGKLRKAQRVVEHLSVLLRSILRQDGPPQISLRKELELVQPYLELMAVRFGDKVRVTFDVTPDAADGLVPRLILQPILENAFLHGVEAQVGPCQIWVVARVDNETLTIEVHDPGPSPLAGSRRGTGLGMRNVRDRLEALGGGCLTLQQVSNRKGTIAVLRLPWQVDAGELVRNS